MVVQQTVNYMKPILKCSMHTQFKLNDFELYDIVKRYRLKG